LAHACGQCSRARDHPRAATRAVRSRRARTAAAALRPTLHVAGPGCAGDRGTASGARPLTDLSDFQSAKLADFRPALTHLGPGVSGAFSAWSAASGIGRKYVTKSE